MSHKDAVSIYSTGVSNLVTISVAGMAAATALMQISSYGENRGWYLWSLITFSVGLVCCFLSMAGLTGQAMKGEPNVNVSNIKYPVGASFLLAIFGFGLLGFTAFSSPKSEKKADSDYMLKKMIVCRDLQHGSSDLRSSCYDTIVDMELNEIEITDEDIKALNDSDKKWLKIFLKRTSSTK